MNTEVMNTASIGKTQSDKAAMFAAMETEATARVIDTVAKANEDWQGGPFVVMKAMEANYGEKLAEFPEPGSDTGNNPDKYKVPRAGKDGVTVMRNASWYSDFTKATPAGRKIVVELEQIKRAQDVNDAKKDVPQSIIDLALNLQACNDRTAYLKRRLAVMQTCYTKAVKLGTQLAKVEDITGVVFQPRYTDDTETALVNTPEPIWVYEPVAKGPIEKQKSLSLSSFMKINVGKAIELGGNLEAVLKTLARDTDVKGETLPPIQTSDTFASRITDVHIFVEKVERESKQAMFGELLKKLNGAGSDDLLVSLTEIRNFADMLLRKVPKSAERYQTAINKEEPASKAA